jgi:hypothetical protein
MTNTYDNNAPLNVKIYEELRLIRCLHERILRAINESQFPEYQMKKFSGNAESRSELRKQLNFINREEESESVNIEIYKSLKNIRETHELLLITAGKTLFEDYNIEKEKCKFKAPTKNNKVKPGEIKPGDVLYIDTDDNKFGGLATVKEVFVDNVNSWVTFTRFPGSKYNLVSLLQEQKQLKKEFGYKWAHFE